MFPILQLGPLAIRTPGLFLLAGVWFGLVLVEASLKRRPTGSAPLDSNTLYNLVFVALVIGLVGARLIYALRYASIFAASPLSLFSLNPGLLDPSGGIVAGLLAAWVYGGRKGLPFWPTLDALTPGLALFGVAYGLAHLASGDAFGTPTNLPWSIELWGAQRQPTQIYETLAALLILAAVTPGISPRKFSTPGIRFLAFTALTSAARLFLEAFRGDSVLLPGGIREAQVIAWLGLAASLLGIWWLVRYAQKALPAREPEVEAQVENQPSSPA